MSEPLFTQEDLISVYSREQALEDGVLVDVSTVAREAGFRWPVALSAGLWAAIEAIPPKLISAEDVQGRLWDVLWMGALAARRSNDRLVLYRLILNRIEDGHRRKFITLKMEIGQDGDGRPFITIMLPQED